MKAVMALVNYHGEQDVAHFVRHELRSQEGVDLRVVIVNNGHTHADVLESIEGVQVLHPPHNVGYLGAASFARQCIGSLDADYFILSNYDLKYPHKHLLRDLLAAGKHAQWQAFGPQIVNMPSGAKANPMYSRRPGKSFYQRLLFVTSFYPIYLFYQWLHVLKKQLSRTTERASTPVYAVHGSMMVFSKTYFDHADFSPAGILYGEEMIVAEECRKHGWSIGFTPELEVIHQEHTSTGRWKNRKHMRYLHEALSNVYRRYYA